MYTCLALPQHRLPLRLRQRGQPLARQAPGNAAHAGEGNDPAELLRYNSVFWIWDNTAFMTARTF